MVGDVFGAGKGVPTHGYSALVRGNSSVTVQGKAKVKGSVYGGGQIASVGRYNVDKTTGLPVSLKNEKSGNCTVIVRDSAEIGPDDMIMTRDGGPDNTGHVFGAGQGAYPYVDKDGNAWADPWRVDPDNVKDIFNDEEKYLKYIESLGLATQTNVTISGHAFVKGDVFGGAEQGYVQHDTHVTIEGDCQIGNGYVQMDDDGTYLGSMGGVNRRYTSQEWSEGRLYPTGTLATLVGSNYQHSLPECASWRYESPYAYHDIYANDSGNLDEYPVKPDGAADKSTKGGRRVASNGHTFYGSVFGGGSGYFPYKAGKWHWNAGNVGGDTYVTITGGHILTNVYGGNEMTNVAGKCTVNMSGGTIGVPRTLGQIMKHPVTCYLFGGGMGDARVFFNKYTNVKDVEVNVTGGTVYGSVFGGGEDGHVLRNVTMTIGKPAVGTIGDEGYVAASGPTIGTWGTSYVDGNIFGGGRGFAGDSYTAGNVAGSVKMTIHGGEILGSVYGGGRLGSVGYGLYDEGAAGYGEMRDDEKDDAGNTVADFMRGHVDITISGGTIGNNHEYKNVTADGSHASLAAAQTALDTWKTTNNIPNTAYETIDNGDGTYTNRLHHTRGGNVYAGGMGRREQLDGTSVITAVDWHKLGNVKSTKLNISGGIIKSNVYGGGEYGAVTGNHTTKDSEDHDVNVGTELIITGGTIGTEIIGASASDVKYTFGSVYGGGTGTVADVKVTTTVAHADSLAAYVADSTMVSVKDAVVKASVFGGGELAAVGGSTFVDISGNAEIGRNEVKPIDDPDPGYVMFGGWRMGNVYGGGRGSDKAAVAGLVKGNTNVRIEGGHIYHNVYGGGALASVGTFALSTGSVPAYMPIAGIPYKWYYTDGTTEIIPASSDGTKTPTGTATVTITGGTIGISGRDNGLVFGGSRGDISDPNIYFTQAEIDAATSGQPGYGKTTNDIKSSGLDPHLRVAWVNKSVVNIGTPKASPSDPNVLTSPLIKGSVYGGAENGHNYTNATVNVYSGTIGITEKIPGTDDTDPWWDFGKPELNEEYYTDRGNVYGAGSGADTYTDRKGNKHYNPKTGMVGGSSVVNISGGHVVHNVYGAGSMASLGNIMNAGDTIHGGSAKHTDENSSFALSWPYKFVFAPNTGKATVNITGGHIGIGGERVVGKDNGNVYGASRGMAGDRYAMAHLAIVKETQVNINFTPTSTEPDEMLGSANYAKNAIEGSVFGGGENGRVMGDTYVTMKDGFVSHSVFGGGRGEGKYKGKLIKVNTGKGRAGAPNDPVYTTERDIYDWTAGKVYGNTHLTIADGRVLNNVLGGGYMASVGVGSYASGSDDFYPVGYGETLKGAETPAYRTLWDKGNDNSLAFWNSGKTFVNVLGGEIGSKSLWDGLPAGNIFGGCRGMAAPNLRESFRYLYNPQWLNGYTNETHVTIGGGYECATACTDKDGKLHTPGEKMSLDELQDLFKGTSFLDGDNMPVEANWTALSGSGPKIYGSVYGGAQDGRVRRDTHVVVNAGEIGLPFTTENRSELVPGAANLQQELDNAQWLHRGNVYGGGSGIGKYQFDINYDGTIDKDSVTYYDGKILEEDYCQFAGSVLRYTTVDILGGTIHRNVYGGGSLGSVGPPAVPPTRTEAAYKPGTTTRDASFVGGTPPANPALGVTTIGEGWWSQNTVNIGGTSTPVTIGTPDDDENGWHYQNYYGGEVYGASRGMSTLNPNLFSHSVWTKVHIKDNSEIKGNVFGGGDNGMVKKSTEVIIGDKKVVTP